MGKIIIFIIAIIFASSLSAQDARILEVPYVNQVYSHAWCWAAASASVILYYGTQVELCEVVEYARSRNPGRFGYENCCNIPTPENCIKTNYWGFTGGILDILNHFIGGYVDGFPVIFTTLTNEINSGRPVYFTRDQHALVLRGYDNPSFTIYYIDPNHGYKIETFTPNWVSQARFTVTPSCSDAISEFSQPINSNLYYEETNAIKLNTTITNADVEFRFGNELIVNPGFDINLGSSLFLNPNPPLACDYENAFEYSLNVDWVQMGPTGQLQFGYSIKNISSLTKTFYLKGTANNGSLSTSIVSHTLSAGQGNGGMLPISTSTQPSNWKFYIREGDSNFTEANVVANGP